MKDDFSYKTEEFLDNSIAIIGMAGRFPGAKNLGEFWHNILHGKDTINHFSNGELLQAGIGEALIQNPHYVKAAGVLEGIEEFDADFFNISPHDASITDPQHRLFLEICWEALEIAGYIKHRKDLLIGVFAGMSDSTYWQNCLLKNETFLKSNYPYQTRIATSANFLATKISYHLNLTGPSLNINTACSTSLVTVVKACQSLLTYECDIALAGGISIRVPQAAGHLYQEGGILSKDGRCRAFDKDATGTVRSGGAGVVVLKRLADALQDKDSIDAVIKGYAINNDGATKVSYTAPSILEQSRCIATALANIDVESINYVEAHGTGTALGDPIEISALTKAFRHYTEKKNYCAIGSVKTNIGHADTAAGIAGLIKAILVLKNRVIPPVVNFREPNPKIDFLNSPFYVNNSLMAWEEDFVLKKAGVSSFGIGGTNAHVVLEEASKYQTSSIEQTKKYQLILLSAKKKESLDKMREALCQYLKSATNKSLDDSKNILADTAFTLQVGRADFSKRYAVVSGDVNDAIAQMENNLGFEGTIDSFESKKPEIVFLFPGQGAQYSQMGNFLYKTESIFKQAIDECCELLKPSLDMDLRAILFPEEIETESDNHLLQETYLTQPALFCIEYALAKLYGSWGIQPHALMGHSLGEFIAAYLAGIFSLEDALKLICVRGKLMSRLEPGSMLAVQASIDELLPLLDRTISVASINTPQACVVSGNPSVITDLKVLLSEKAILFQQVPISHAFHSVAVETIIPEFINEIQKITLHQPMIPIISNLTGQWAAPEQLMDPHYWGQQLRQTVHFSAGIETLSQTLSNPIFIECGPGHTLTNWVKKHKKGQRSCIAVSSMLSMGGHQESRDHDDRTIFDALAKLWLHGVDIDWAAYHETPRHRMPLPTYCFEKKRYWIEPGKSIDKDGISINAEKDLWRCFYQPSWTRLALLNFLENIDADKFKNKCWLIFAYDDALVSYLRDKLHSLNSRVICVYEGEQFKKTAQDIYYFNPKELDAYEKLLTDLSSRMDNECQVIHLWGLNGQVANNNFEKISNILYRGLYSITFFVKAFSSVDVKIKFNILLVSDYLQSVFADEICCPTKATILGACQTIPIEYNNIQITTLDISKNKHALSEQQLAHCFITETIKITTRNEVKHLAYRHGYIWEKTFQPLESKNQEDSIESPMFRQQGVYLITGGLGGIGISLAQYLSTVTSAHIALVSRTVIPKPEEWDIWLQHNSSKHPYYDIVKKLHLLKTHGVSISVWDADISSYEQMHKIIILIEQTRGVIHGVVHAAGVPGSGLIQKKNISDIYKVLQPKLFGTYVLSQLFKDKPLDFIVLFSSLNALTGGIGQLDYCAANAALDAFPHAACFHAKTLITTIHWNAWLEVGMRERAIRTSKSLASHLYDLNKDNTITPEQGFTCFSFLLKEKLKNLIVSRISLQTLIKNVSEYRLSSLSQKDNFSIEKPIEKNKDKLSEKIIAIFKDILGIERLNVTDSFFALGGDSLSALSLIDRVGKELGTRLSLNQLYQIKTPFQLTKFIEDSSSQIAASPLVLLNPTGQIPALFLVHPVGGTIFRYVILSERLKSQKVYAIQDPGLMQSHYRFNTLEEMASYYLAEIQKVQTSGPYYIAGYSMGGTIAFEMAHQLLQNGDKVAFLGLLDSWAIFTEQFRDKSFFEEKMRNHLKLTEEKLKSFLPVDIDSWLTRQWERMQLLLQYKPEILDCKIRLFKARELLPEYRLIDDSYNHWQPYSKYPVDKFYVSGNHDTLFSMAHVGELARILLDSLKKNMEVVNYV